MAITISGKITSTENLSGISGLTVEAYDDDIFFDDSLGSATTDSNGAFKITFDKLKAGIENPDIFLLAKTPKGDVLRSTYSDIRRDVCADITINLTVPEASLYQTGFINNAPGSWQNIANKSRDKSSFNTLTLRSDCDPNDPLLMEIQAELSEKVSVLDLMKQYADELYGVSENDMLPFKKLDKLFEVGSTFADMPGHSFGIGLGLKTYGASGFPAELRNMLNYFYSTLQGRDSVWIGKTMWKIDQKEIDTITEGNLKTEATVYRGINHFNNMETNRNSPFFFNFADFWLNMENGSETEKEKYGIEKNGAKFIAYQTDSVQPTTTQKVFRLIYRWPFFNNPLPIKWILDEMVQIAKGVYLGQLLCASRRLLNRFDPKMDSSAYGYLNWGYFLLVTDDWQDEAKRLFPYLDVAPK